MNTEDAKDNLSLKIYFKRQDRRVPSQALFAILNILIIMNAKSTSLFLERITHAISSAQDLASNLF